MPGSRGEVAIGGPCGADGQTACASSICVDDTVCTDRCDTAEDCPDGFSQCVPIAFSGSDDSWCLP